MNDDLRGGDWRWNSDKSEVEWTLWAEFTTWLEPNGGDNDHCVMMIKNHDHTKRQSSTASWADIMCSDQQYDPISLVCQKPAGKFSWEIKKQAFKLAEMKIYSYLILDSFDLSRQ